MPAEGIAGGPPYLARRVASLRGLARIAVAMAAGAMGALSLPPLHLWPALILAMAAILWLLDGIAEEKERPGRRALVAFLTGWSFGFGYFVLSLYWIGFAFLVEADVFAVLLPLGVAGLPAYLALYWGAAALLAMLAWRPGSLERAVAFALALALAEWLRGHLLTGFPWNAPGYAASAFDGLSQLAALVGLPGLTLLTLVWAAAAVVLLESVAGPGANRQRACVAGALLLTAPAAWAAGAARIPQAEAPFVAGIGLRVVQANIPQAQKWRAERREEVLRAYEALSASGAGPSGFTHLIWPESALPALVDESPAMRARLAQLLPRHGILLLGALRREPAAEADSDAQRVYNSVLALDHEAGVVATYDKWRLVPFGEFLPWASLLEPLGLRKLVPLPGSFAAGQGERTLRAPSTPPFAPLVCYEAIFPDRLVDSRDRPDWLLNLTNDGWFGISAGPYQHLEQARLRAVEQGLPLVRAANTGISAVIDPYGRIIASLPLGGAGIIETGLPQPLQATVYARHGDAGFFAMLVLGSIIMLLRLRR